MSNLVKHAEFELKRAGLFDEDSDYGGMLGKAVLDLVKRFAEEGHSGASAAQTIAIFHRLAQFKPLTPLTSDPSEWMQVAEEMLAPQQRPALWQNTRRSTTFSRDGGKTWYDIDNTEENNGDTWEGKP